MKTKSIKLTKREAEVVMTAIDLAVQEFGVPDCPKCLKAFWSVVRKLDETFELGALPQEAAS